MKCDKNPHRIQNMFNEISGYYDDMNNLISLGMHYIIKFLSIKALDIKPNTMVLDACCGTGDFSRIISRFYPSAKVIGLDFSAQMIKFAKQKNPKNVFIQGDCTNLPFGENEFDYVTMGFGLRNINDRTKALYEIHRVLKNGGKFLHLDFGNHNKISQIFNIIVPFIVKISGKNSEHYKYLLASKDCFPQPDDLIKEFESRGFKFLKRQDYLFGTISAQIMRK